MRLFLPLWLIFLRLSNNLAYAADCKDIKQASISDYGGFDNFKQTKLVDCKGATSMSGEDLKLNLGESVLNEVFETKTDLQMSIELANTGWGEFNFKELTTMVAGKELKITKNPFLTSVLIGQMNCDCALIVRGNPLLSSDVIRNLKGVVNSGGKMTAKSAIQRYGECTFPKGVDDLSQLKDCRSIYGDLRINGRAHGGLGKNHRLEFIDGCLIMEDTTIENAWFLMATPTNCQTYNYIGGNRKLCDHEILRDSLYKANPDQRVFWTDNCNRINMTEVRQQKTYTRMAYVDPDFKRDSLLSDDWRCLLVISLAISLLFVVYIIPFCIPRMTSTYDRKRRPYTPYGPMSLEERGLVKEYKGYVARRAPLRNNRERKEQNETENNDNPPSVANAVIKADPGTEEKDEETKEEYKEKKSEKGKANEKEKREEKSKKGGEKKDEKGPQKKDEKSKPEASGGGKKEGVPPSDNPKSKEEGAHGGKSGKSQKKKEGSKKEKKAEATGKSGESKKKSKKEAKKSDSAKKK